MDSVAQRTVRITKADLNERGEYVASSSLVVNGHLEVERDLGFVRFVTGVSVSGRIVVEAGSGIECAGEGIKAGEGIEPGEDAQLRLCAWRLPKPEETRFRS